MRALTHTKNAGQPVATIDDLVSGIKSKTIDPATIEIQHARLNGTDYGQHSDIDVFVESTSLVRNLSSNKFGMTHPRIVQNRYSALRKWSEKWSEILKRKVSVAGYKKDAAPRADAITDAKSNGPKSNHDKYH